LGILRRKFIGSKLCTDTTPLFDLEIFCKSILFLFVLPSAFLTCPPQQEIAAGEVLHPTEGWGKTMLRRKGEGG